jgi:hypothetical protein
MKFRKHLNGLDISGDRSRRGEDVQGSTEADHQGDHEILISRLAGQRPHRQGAIRRPMRDRAVPFPRPSANSNRDSGDRDKQSRQGESRTHIQRKPVGECAPKGQPREPYSDPSRQPPKRKPVANDPRKVESERTLPPLPSMKKRLTSLSTPIRGEAQILPSSYGSLTKRRFDMATDEVSPVDSGDDAAEVFPPSPVS